jgi:YkoP domain
MTSLAPGSTAEILTALGTASAAWPDELWAGSVGWLDAVLRSFYGIHEFTDDPACVFRIGTGQARAGVSLADGTRIEAGEVVGTLHFWNEQLPRYSRNGPDLGWARAMHDQVQYSLCALAEYIEHEPGWQEVRALHGEAALTARLGSPQVARVAERYGFERVSVSATCLQRLHALGGSFMLWGLTRAFNPAALPRQSFLRDHQDLWITRTTLRQRYTRGRRGLLCEMTRSEGA